MMWNEIPTQFTRDFLRERISEMRTKIVSEGVPGWRGYRQYGDYIRQAISTGCATYQLLGLSGELELLNLELECHELMVQERPHDFVLAGLGYALQARIRELKGREVKLDPVVLHFGLSTDKVRAA